MPTGEPGRYTNAGVNLCEVESDPLRIQIAGTLVSTEDWVSAACQVRPRLLAGEVERRPPEAATAPSPAEEVGPVIEVESSDEENQGRGEPQLPSRVPDAAPLNIGSDGGTSGETRSSGQTSWHNLDTGVTSEASSLLAAPTRVCDFKVSCHSKCVPLPEYAVLVLDECRVEMRTARRLSNEVSGGASSTQRLS